MATKKDNRATEAVLKERVNELEEEVSRLKKRLDDLRKAKNQTILKRDREVVEIGTPFGKRTGSGNESKMTELKKELADKDKERQEELEELRQRFAAEMEEFKKANSETKCDHEELIEALENRITDVESRNMALLIENTEAKAKIDNLLQELSVKEAQSCHTEEEFNFKLQTKWQEMYGKWMESTEKKIEELQQANALLRRMVRPPAGGDTERRPNAQR